MRNKELMMNKVWDKAAMATKEINTIQKKWYFSLRQQEGCLESMIPPIKDFKAQKCKVISKDFTLKMSTLRI